MSSEDHRNVGGKSEDFTVAVPDVWPEVERAVHLARGAALKWASVIFCRPEHLKRLNQYSKSESERTASMHTRLKVTAMEHTQMLMVHSYLEEVGWGMVQLREALAELSEPSQTLKKAGVEFNRNQDEMKSLERLRAVSVNHRQLFTAVSYLPRLYSGKELWAVVSNALAVVRQNPTSFVSTVRIIEREEAIDRILLEEQAEGNARPLPPGRPRCWRACFFKVLEEAVTAPFRSVSFLPTQGPGLARHLSNLQHALMDDLATVRHLLEPCVPSHYRLTRAYIRASHHCLHAHLTQVSSWDLESGEIFALLNWVLHIYNSSEMMGHPELLYEMQGEKLEPLISPEGLEQLQNKYVTRVRKNVSEWMQKALQVELQDWQRDQEPDTDHEGFYQTSLPTIITQMLEENARVALLIGEALRNQTIQMGLYEMENLLNRFREALMDFWKERRSDPLNSKSKFYLHYLLASISNCIILKKSTESLQQQQSSGKIGLFSRTPPNPLAGLDRVVRRACRIVMDQLLLDLKPFLTGLLTRPWLVQGEPTPKLCHILQYHLDLYSHVQPPCRQRLQEEAQWLMVVEYVKALMQKRLICRSAEERRKFTQQMVKDNQQFGDIFHDLEGDGLLSEVKPLNLLPVLADFIKLKDPSMLPLEVSGLATKYPDISEEHVSVLLDIRGDISRDIRVSALELLQHSTAPLPPGYRPIFTDIQVPPSTMAFCLPTAKCA
ncbi:exocyst complex component 3-like protein isoform X5 [Hippocampus zosterae]|uniref:exocyst complex component 3-like protein isoform X5 n=1 Tax=Hippocampus zosterae TaxID=109293 RepID=UPI00223CD08E|nr:exocyst complex component 3-like protein isoform X5 [Hippocampus zosterae]